MSSNAEIIRCSSEHAQGVTLMETAGCPLCSRPEQLDLAEYQGKFLKRCLHCGASYVFPQPSPTEVAAHFQEDCADDQYLARKFELNRERVLSRVADYIQHDRSGGAILDVGCATGLFLVRFFRSPAWQASGLELTPTAAKKAAAKGVRVFCGDVHQAKFAVDSFDVITVLDALYYFPDPCRDLAGLRRVLRPDGLLIIELPLATSRIWRTSRPLGRLLSGSRRPLLESSDHLFYFTPKSMSLLLERCGFQVQAIVPLCANSQAQPLRNLAFQMYSRVSLAVHFLSHAKIFLGPRFLVAATKTSQEDAR
jgi:SAM-dependent methyltransferase